MSTTERTESKRPRADRCHEIEGKHFGRCLQQAWSGDRRTLIEMMDWPKAKRVAIVVKQFEDRVPRTGSSKPWPDLASAQVYCAASDDNTWDGLDADLSRIESRSA